MNGASPPTLTIVTMTLRLAHFPSGMIKSAISGSIEVIRRVMIKVSLSTHLIISSLTNYISLSLDCRSNCTSFDGQDNIQSPSNIKHCYTNTDVDHSSHVFNGDIARAYDSSSTREHHLHGGSVKNQSRLVNGDLDRDTFLAIFCNSNNEARPERGQRGDTHPRRRGQREEARPRRRGQRMEG